MQNFSVDRFDGRLLFSNIVSYRLAEHSHQAEGTKSIKS